MTYAAVPDEAVDEFVDTIALPLPTGTVPS
jgi:hypothetical protein